MDTMHTPPTEFEITTLAEITEEQYWQDLMDAEYERAVAANLVRRAA
jgi:hypothetical protein